MSSPVLFIPVPDCNESDTESVETSPPSHVRYFEKGNLERQDGISEEDEWETLTNKVSLFDKKSKIYNDMMEKMMEKMTVIQDIMEFREREYKTTLDRVLVENFNLKQRILRIEQEIL